MKRAFFTIMLLAAAMLLISSCASLSSNGVGRVKHYTIESERLPASFDGLKIAFLSDLHLPSKFTVKRLEKVARYLKSLSPDAVMLGGDYASSLTAMQTLFSTFSTVKTNYGIYAVSGNHDYRFSSEMKDMASRNGVALLSDSVAFLVEGSDSIAVVGVYNPFKPSPAVKHLISTFPDDVFVILLSHTPDYAQDDGVICDVALSGHTHGGQVSFLRIYTPVKNTKYGKRFLRGMNFTDKGVPVITSNGVGTSRRKVRFCVPSEIIVVSFVQKRLLLHK